MCPPSPDQYCGRLAGRSSKGTTLTTPACRGAGQSMTAPTPSASHITFNHTQAATPAQRAAAAKQLHERSRYMLQLNTDSQGEAPSWVLNQALTQADGMLLLLLWQREGLCWS